MPSTSPYLGLEEEFGDLVSVNPDVQAQRDNSRLQILTDELGKEADPEMRKAIQTEINNLGGGTAMQRVSGKIKVAASQKVAASADMVPVVNTNTEIKDYTPAANIKSQPSDIESQVLQLATKSDQKFQDLEATSQTLGSQIRKNIEEQMAGVRAGGELKAKVSMDKWQQESQKAGENAAILSKLGINTSDMDSTIAQIATELQADFKDAMALRATIDERRTVSFFDSPLQSLINGFANQGDIKRHNALVQKIEAEKGFIDTATGVASKVQAVNATKFTSLSLEGAKASAELDRVAANEKALELQDKLIKTDFDTQVTMLNASNARIRNLDSIITAQQNMRAKADLEAIRNAKAEQEKIDNYRVGVAATMLGMDIPDRKSLDKSPKDVKEAVEYIMANGGVVGKSPLEAWAILNRGNTQNMPPAVKYMKDSLDYIQKSAYRTIVKDPLLKTANAKQTQEALDKQMTIEMGKLADNPNQSIRPTFSGVADNPYHVPNLDVMTGIPEVRSLRLTKILGDYQKQFPGKSLTDSLVIELAYANVGKNKAYTDMTDAAREVSKYYQAGASFNNQKMRFSNFGLQDETSYNVNGIDMMDYARVMRFYLAKERSATSAANLSEVYGSRIGN